MNNCTVRQGWKYTFILLVCTFILHKVTYYNDIRPTEFFSNMAWIVIISACIAKLTVHLEMRYWIHVYDTAPALVKQIVDSATAQAKLAIMTFARSKVTQEAIVIATKDLMLKYDFLSKEDAEAYVCRAFRNQFGKKLKPEVKKLINYHYRMIKVIDYLVTYRIP